MVFLEALASGGVLFLDELLGGLPLRFLLGVEFQLVVQTAHRTALKHRVLRLHAHAVVIAARHGLGGDGQTQRKGQGGQQCSESQTLVHGKCSW